MLRVAVDAMGGDRAPLEIVRGAEAASSEKIAEIVLGGDENQIASLVEQPEGIEIVHTPIFVEMKESPSTATTGVERPAILTTYPNVTGTVTTMIDAGGTVDCCPSHLAQFAIMGNAFAHHALGIENPRIGLLSNEEEESKGNELTRDTHGILKTLNFNYVGHVGGTELYNGPVGVVVTDGFVGNVALKVSEGELSFLSGMFRDLFHRMDYSEHGGAPLIGVDGVCTICHGKSDGRAIKNAIARTVGLVGKDMNRHVSETIQHYATPTKV
jgi:phosphate acyltransferase